MYSAPSITEAPGTTFYIKRSGEIDYVVLLKVTTITAATATTTTTTTTITAKTITIPISISVVTAKTIIRPRQP